MHKLTACNFVLLTVMAALVSFVHCKVITNTPNLHRNTEIDSLQQKSTNFEESKQLFVGAQGKETSTPNFVRLLVMRLIYGLASTMGLEERLDGAFNGAFVPPNADEDLFGFGGGLDDDDGGDVAEGLGGIFDADDIL